MNACLSAFPCQVVGDTSATVAFPRDCLKFYEDGSGNPSKSTLNVLCVAPALQSRCGRRDGMTRESRIKLYSEETTQRR